MENIEIRDLRRKQYFMVDDEYLNGYARLCGIAATGVYTSLCRHSNKDQKAWPSILLIAQELEISDRTVKRAIKTLTEWGIIETERSRNEKTKCWNVTIYTLKDKVKWKAKPLENNRIKSKPQDTTTYRATGHHDGHPQDKNDKKPQDTTTSKGYTVGTEGNTYRLAEGEKAKQQKTQKPETIAVEVIREFKEAGNETLTYGNITQRTAIERLAKTHGEDKVRIATRYAISLQKETYAPHISTPLELELKWQKLRDYYVREKGRKGGIAFVS